MATFHLIPHTHWDREWYLPRAAFEARLVPMVQQALELLERHPALRFHLDGQSILIEDYLRVVPEHRGRIESRVREGRLAVGPWYVLADQIIPSGEALLRNLLIGRTLARQLGDRCNVWYSPDAFGHPAAVPRLARALGIDNAVVWRGASSGPDLFLWAGRNGPSLRTYHLPPDGYEIGSTLVGDDAELARAWHQIRPGLLARAASSEIAVFVGADHHAPDAALATLAARLAVLEPDNSVRMSSLEEFFAAVERVTPSLQTVRGELRAPGHTWALQGVHGTRLRLKRRYGGAELALSRVAEPLTALCGRGRPALGAAWRRLVAAQFHDTLAGSIADQVAAEQEVRLGAVEAGVGELVRDGLHAMVEHDPDDARQKAAPIRPTLVVWSPVPRTRGGVVVVRLTGFRGDVLVGPPGGRPVRTGPGFVAEHLVDEAGRSVRLQVLGRSVGLERIDAARHYPDADRVDFVWAALQVKDLPGLGTRCLYQPGASEDAGPSRTTGGAVRVSGSTVETEGLAIRWSKAQSLTLDDRLRGHSFPGLASLESSGDEGDCYTPAIRSPGRNESGCREVRPLAEGPLIGSLSASWTVDGPAGRIDGRTVATLYHGSPIVRLLIEFDNYAANHRLRLRFPTGIDGEVTAGAVFGALRRPPGQLDESWPNETRLPTDPAHRYVAAARGSRGLAVLAPGFFEYQWTERGDLLVTLVRSVGELSKGNLPTRPGHAGWPTPTPGAQELGRHRIELGIAPIDEYDLADPARLNAVWEDTFLPPVTRWLRDGLVRRPTFSGIQLEGEGLVLEAVKPAESGDGVVIRVANLLDRVSGGRLRFGQPVEGAWRLEADETSPRELPLDGGGSSLGFDADGGGLLTIAVSGLLQSVGQ